MRVSSPASLGCREDIIAGGDTREVTPHGLVECSCGYLIQRRKVAIEYDLFATDEVNQPFHRTGSACAARMI